MTKKEQANKAWLEHFRTTPQNNLGALDSMDAINDYRATLKAAIENTHKGYMDSKSIFSRDEILDLLDLVTPLKQKK